ncbi:MAG: DNA-binding protein [Flavobacteriaceae bacterium]|nr:DNA-binding protein [Flavobacteriaceae bacterium]
MAIPYRITKRKNTIQNEEECKYILQAVTKREVDLRRISWEISNMSTHTEGDVFGVLIMLVQQVKFHLEQGETVVLDDLGRFKVKFQCEPADSPEKLTVKNIRKFTVNYLPSPRLRKWLKSSVDIVKEKNYK